MARHVSPYFNCFSPYLAFRTHHALKIKAISHLTSPKTPQYYSQSAKVGLVDYFDELLARIREIRASEARVYQRIRDIFALASDYVEDDQETQRFFATMQNKMQYAASGMTAAEIVRRRADATKANMGLTS